MPITMQGSWTVAVKVKNAAYPQRFVISGATTGNGTYTGDMATPPVYVTGNAWVITIQNNPGPGFIESDTQIKFPVISAGQYKFDIESNDAWVGDKDFNDLILTCSMPQTQTDFLLYGNVSYYSGCIFNPCFRHIVIDNRFSLLEALKNPILRIPIEKLYPERIPQPGPPPEDRKFRPLVIPLQEETAIPAKLAQVSKVADTSKVLKAERTEKVATTMAVTASRTVSLASSALTRVDFDRVAVAGILDKFRPVCKTGTLPGVVLRFQEYDRTAAELSGGAYSGNGARETLGACVTDRNGNYIFRFSRSIAQFLEEAAVDVAVGEDETVQSMPDVIVQLLDSTAPNGVAFESAPYWNVPVLKRINICIPKGDVGRIPVACQGSNAIQSIGNIFIGAPQIDGSRVGFNNFLSADGKITAMNTLPSTPQARCAAWQGNLDLFACFLDLPNVKYYTIRFRRQFLDLSWSDWNFFQQEYKHPLIAHIFLPNYNGDLVGPQVGVQLAIDGGPKKAAPAYLNIENDNAWIFTHRDRKAVIVTTGIVGEPALVEFWIEGYDSAGLKVTAADDKIKLFIDNTNPDYQILDVKMLGTPGGDCALFTLPADQLDAPLTMKFKANQFQGFLNAYGVSVRKGNISSFSIVGMGPGAISGAYVHGDNLDCEQLRGTLDDPTSDALGVVTADIKPAAGGWLTADQNFCTFAVNLDCSTRVTNGYNTAIRYYGTTQYLLGIQK